MSKSEEVKCLHPNEAPHIYLESEYWVRYITKDKFDDFTFVTVNYEERYRVDKYLMELMKASKGNPDAPFLKLQKMYKAVPFHLQQEQSHYTMYKDIFAQNQANGPLYTLKPADGEWVIEFGDTTLFLLSRSTMKIFVQGANNLEPIPAFLEMLLEKYGVIERPPDIPPTSFEVYRFKQGYWQIVSSAKLRPMNSVILPKVEKDNLLQDVEEFLSKETREWYEARGIPYKRSYLFYGIPGTGKTSLITALATTFKLKVCFLSLTTRFTDDDNLANTIAQAPSGAILVIEDVDALFTQDREKKMESGLTFSGLLNALDGIGSAFGQVVVLTTNHREKLDPALIRAGRVDFQFEFTYMRHNEIADMLESFYPDVDKALAQQFAKEALEVSKKVKKTPCLTAAMLQNYFITHRKCGVDDILAQVSDLGEIIKSSL